MPKRKKVPSATLDHFDDKPTLERLQSDDAMVVAGQTGDLPHFGAGDVDDEPGTDALPGSA